MSIVQIDAFMAALVIDDCDQPFPPLVLIHRVDAGRIVVVWRVDAKYQTANTKAILCFSVQWCRLPKAYLKEDEEKKREKQRKKEKKRKRSAEKEESRTNDLLTARPVGETQDSESRAQVAPDHCSQSQNS